jgi:hypothetical protein
MSVETYSPLVLVGPEEQPATGWVRNSVMSYPDGYDGTWHNESWQEGRSFVAHYVRPDRPDLRVDDAYYITREEDEDEHGIAEGTYSYRVIRDLRLVWLRPDGTWFRSYGPGDVYVDEEDYTDIESASKFARERVTVDKASRLEVFQGRDHEEIRETDV